MPHVDGGKARNAQQTPSSRALEPWAQLTVGGESLAPIRAGGNAVVIGPTGGGKTSLVAAIAIDTRATSVPWS